MLKALKQWYKDACDETQRWYDDICEQGRRKEIDRQREVLRKHLEELQGLHERNVGLQREFRKQVQKNPRDLTAKHLSSYYDLMSDYYKIEHYTERISKQIQALSDDI